jgi:hypothetical protein
MDNEYLKKSKNQLIEELKILHNERQQYKCLVKKYQIMVNVLKKKSKKRLTRNYVLKLPQNQPGNSNGCSSRQKHTFASSPATILFNKIPAALSSNSDFLHELKNSIQKIRYHVNELSQHPEFFDFSKELNSIATNYHALFLKKIIKNIQNSIEHQRILDILVEINQLELLVQSFTAVTIPTK